MDGLPGNPHLIGNFAEGEILFTVERKDAALLLRKHSAVKSGKKSKIHLALQVFPVHREPSRCQAF